MNSRTIKKKMSSALMRSGYLMESRIVTNLARAGYFIEPNQRIADSKTGKAREIDLIAELWDYNPDNLKQHNLSVSVKFVCEAKNNPNPVVLLTELPFSPNIEVWEAVREGRTGSFKSQHVDLSFHEFLEGDNDIFTQYCSFKPKRNDDKLEWAAFHPDDFYDDLEKIISYCDESIEMVNKLGDKYHRLHLYLPVVILGGDLYISAPTARTINLKRVPVGYFMYFGVRNGQQFLALIVFVTEKHLLKFFEQTNEISRFLEKQFIDSAPKQQIGTTIKSRRR
jgi:hypothetical protein